MAHSDPATADGPQRQRLTVGERVYDVEMGGADQPRVWLLRAGFNGLPPYWQTVHRNSDTWRRVVQAAQSALRRASPDGVPRGVPRGVTVEAEAEDLTAGRFLEPCCLCRHPTRYWYRPHDVALCMACATTATPRTIPTKLQWLNAELAPGETPLPQDWQPNLDRHRR